MAVDNEGGGAVIDATYPSELVVTGTGFQSIKGGHGGVYVWFGTVEAGWQPSRGGKSGTDFVYVPDSESRGNAGFQRYVAFPGSDTAASANGGTMRPDGSWRVRLVVPGPTFQGVGRDGTVRTVDCRTVTCGVITVGAHGVANANNESFTPVTVRRAGPAPAEVGPSPTASAAALPAAAPATSGAQVPEASPAAGPSVVTARPSGPARLRIDRRSAVAGRALAFAASGLRAGEQVSVVLDDGMLASGPHVVGNDGRVTGVLALPAETGAGTHELRLFGASRKASVKFGVASAEPKSASVDEVVVGRGWWREDRAAWLFVAGAALAFAAALLVALRRTVGRRRAYA